MKTFCGSNKKLMGVLFTIALVATSLFPKHSEADAGDNLTVCGAINLGFMGPTSVGATAVLEKIDKPLMKKFYRFAEEDSPWFAVAGAWAAGTTLCTVGLEVKNHMDAREAISDASLTHAGKFSDSPRSSTALPTSTPLAAGKM